MNELRVIVSGDTGYRDDQIEHADVDRLHYYMDCVIGHHAWGKCRDAMAGIVDGNVKKPTFETAMQSYLDIMHEWGYLALSTSLVVLSGAAAWIWIANSKRNPHD